MKYLIALLMLLTTRGFAAELPSEARCALRQQTQFLKELAAFATEQQLVSGSEDETYRLILASLRGIQTRRENQSISFNFQFEHYHGTTEIYVDSLSKNENCNFVSIYTSGSSTNP